MAVDALGVVLALLADAAALVVEVDVEREAVGVDLLVVLTLVGVAVAVARLALEFVNVAELKSFVEKNVEIFFWSRSE